MNDDRTQTLSASQISASRLPTGMTPEFVGERLKQFEVISTIGAGGVGCVFKARQHILNRLVALKVLRGEWVDDPTFVERFRREAAMLANFNHPGIVTVHDYGESGDLCYIAMELVDGSSLRDLIDAGPVPPARAFAIADELCQTLSAAHRSGIIHRDIKPSNILIDRNGRIKLVDFGLSKMRETQSGEYTLTTADTRMGTPVYVAPEQWRDPKHADERADIFALGVVVYEMLTGQKPIGNYERASSRSGLSSRIDTVLGKAMENDPSRRYFSVEEFRIDLSRAFRSRRIAPRNVAIAAGVAATLAIALGFIMPQIGRPSRKAASSAPSTNVVVHKLPAAPGGVAAPPVIDETFSACEY